jgi:ATP-dependent helicase/nuclease subunit A
VTPGTVILADFKTGTPSPEVPTAYVTQLALYRRLLMPLWPGHVFHTLLVWTQGPRIVELDPAQLDAAVFTPT